MLSCFSNYNIIKRTLKHHKNELNKLVTPCPICGLKPHGEVKEDLTQIRARKHVLMHKNTSMHD